MFHQSSSCPYRKWFGVNAISSAGCDDWYVDGILLIKPSAQKQSQVLRHLCLHSPVCFWLLFCCFDHYFMSSTKMWCCWRIEWTLNCFICCVLLDLLLIQLIHQIFRFFLCFHKITSIVWKHYFRNTSSTCHSRKCAKKWINIHLEWHLQMYCLGIQTRE